LPIEEFGGLVALMSMAAELCNRQSAIGNRQLANRQSAIGKSAIGNWQSAIGNWQ